MAAAGLAENVLFRLHRSEAEMLRGEIAALQADPARAEDPSDVSAAVQGALTLCSNAHAVCRWAWRVLSENRVRDFEQLGRRLEQTLTLTLLVLRLAQELVQYLEDQQRTAPEEAGALVRAAEQVLALQADYLQNWPWPPTPEEVADAETECQSGQAPPLAAAFAEVAGMDQTEWAQRVAARRQANGSDGVASS